MKLTIKQLRGLIREAGEEMDQARRRGGGRAALGFAIPEDSWGSDPDGPPPPQAESPDELAAKLVMYGKNVRGRLGFEDLGGGEVYIMTGEAEGITVRVVRRGK